jgi:hypothetical protein
MQDEIQWCECPCQRCKRILRFKPQQAGNRVNCPFCKGTTLLQVADSKTKVPFLNHLKRLGGWTPIVLALIGLLTISGFGAYKLASQMNPLLMAAGSFVAIFYTTTLIYAVAAQVGSVIFLVFLIKWMFEVRKLLRGIEQNTRPEKGLLSTLVPHASETTSADHRKAEPAVLINHDLKYMPQT